MEITNRISDGNHLTRESVERRKNWMKITNRISCGNHLTRVSVKVTIHCNCSFLKQLLYQLLHLQISSIVYHGGYDGNWDDDYNDDDDNADDDMKYDDDFVLDVHLKD